MKKVIMLLFVFSISLNLTAQKLINIDTLNIDQPNLDKLKAVDMRKAVNMRKAGMILTFSGVGILIASNIVGFTIANIQSDDPYNYPWGGGFIAGAYILIIGNSVGLATTVVGTPLWIIGGKRINKIALALKTFNIVPENSLALGLGITIRF
jgi:hypothetical protein